MAEKKNHGKVVRVADWMTEEVLAVESFDSIALARQADGEASGEPIASLG